MTHYIDAVPALSALRDVPEVDGTTLNQYLDFAAVPAHMHRETSSAQHLTVSAFVFNESLTDVLLCFHGKGKFWVQFGGHVEAADAGLFEAAQREAIEESGLASLTPLSQDARDLDRHDLNSGFGSCQTHWDVGFAFTAAETAKVVVSDESEDVQWWPIHELPAAAVPGLGERILRVLAPFSR